MELDLPPIELHASTQCDIRSVEKAKFLSDAGFSQIVLARELNLSQIKAIYENTDATIEFFIHGALCVAYSGQCYISHAQTGRSANRGDCSQACRLPYTLKDDQGRVVAYEKHLLSMKDNDQTANGGADRCRGALLQNRRPLQRHELREKHHRSLPPDAGRHH